MKDLFSSETRAALTSFLRQPTLVAFDYDGTLAPLGVDPTRTGMRPSTKRLLREVARAYPCVVITGRSRDSVWPFFRGVGIQHVAGNHGA
ncbi:MAG: trehalose-phosphatase, partial [Pseudomonadota bacterium]